MAFRARFIAWTTSLVSLVAVACGDDEVGPMDASSSDASEAGAPVDGAFPEPTPVEPPAPPTLGPCPDGWAEVTLADAVVCEPWPAGEGGCPEGEARFPGDAVCAPLAPCPTGDFADDLPAGARTLYVLSGSTGGDGSLGAPFARLDEATALATSGDVIALGRGTYEGVVTLGAGVVLVGACPSATTITGPAGALSDSTLRLEPGASVSGIAISAARPGVRVDVAGEPAVLRNVWVDANGIGILATMGASIRGERIGVRVGMNGRFSYGSFVHQGSSLELDAAMIERVYDGVAVGDAGSTFVGTRVVVRDTLQSPVREPSPAVTAVGGASIRLSESWLERTRGAAIVTVGDGSTAEVDQIGIRGVLAEAPDGEAGFGALGGGGALLVLDRSSIQHATTTGIALVEASELRASDLVSADTLIRPADGIVAGSLHVLDGAQATVERMVTSGSHGADIAIEGPGTTADISDVVARGSRDTQPLGIAGSACSVADGATATLTRLRVRDVEGIGVVVSRPQTAAVLTDIDVEDVRATSIGIGGRGIGIQLGADVTVTRARVVRTTEVGILVHGGETRRAIALFDVDVRETRENEASGAAMGIVAIEGIDLVVTRFSVADNALAGFQIVSGATTRASFGVVSGNAVGVNFQLAGSGAEGFTDHVYFTGNGMNLDSADLPLPVVTPGP